MADDPTTRLLARLEALDRELKDLKARVAALERLMGSGAEHASDQTTVRKKVAYDWQT